MSIFLLISLIISSVATQSGQPEFDKPLEEVVLEEGALQKVECVAKGELPLTYTWYNKNDVVISSDANADIFTRRSQNGSSLIFAEAKPSHAGLYSCSATNKHGTETKLYDITVNSTSGNITANETAEIFSVKVINITVNSIEFDVQTKRSLEEFYIRYKEQEFQVEYSVKINKGDKAVVKNLVASGRYEFHFQIEKPSRFNIPSPAYFITLLPDVPDVIFRNVQDGLVEVEWFRSIDDISRRTIEEFELSYYPVLQIGGRSWKPSDCVVTIKIPNLSCTPARYTIAGLNRGIYYEIRIRKRTSAGYGKPFINKIYMK